MRFVTIYYLKDAAFDKAQISEITGEYPIYPKAYEKMFVRPIPKSNRRNPLKVCESYFNRLSGNSRRSDPLLKQEQIRPMGVGDICRVNDTFLRVATYGLTNISDKCQNEIEPLCAPKYDWCDKN